ncbi:MAG: hypothetical protein H6855_06515 [Rhodospirillales bacterium]|nr:hypothetical protein [Rhodospirillales bacterium]MCB9965716.1 hypothetical protein [Rhodospirillales bacterium]MCB9980081.1 hypothetical protein [Rhodospirillales bacterium]
MGSLTSRPKVPTTPLPPQTIYVPQPAPVTPSVLPSAPAPSPKYDEGGSGSGTDTGSGTQPPTTASSDNAVRVENLLRRNRGLTGTILTGFKGLLSQSELVPHRKTLLGE